VIKIKFIFKLKFSVASYAASTGNRLIGVFSDTPLPAAHSLWGLNHGIGGVLCEVQPGPIYYIATNEKELDLFEFV
jgi:hypothetical protein